MPALQDHEAKLRRLAISDERLLGRALAGSGCEPGSQLDDRDLALARLAAVVVSDAPLAAFLSVVSRAQAVGVTPDELVDVLIGVAPVVGSVVVVSAAPKLALALGYDVEVDLEELRPADA